MGILTRKVTLFPVGEKEEVDKVYKALRDGMKSQNKAMNQYMTALYMAQTVEMSKDDRKELNKFYTRIPKPPGIDTKKESAYVFGDIEFFKGLPMGSSVGMKVRQDFGNAMKKGLMYGRISLPTYRDNNPLLIHRKYVQLRDKGFEGFYHNYETNYDFYEAMMTERNPEVYLGFVQGITFKVVFGNAQKSEFLRHEFINIFNNCYKLQGSSIGFDKSGKKIILNLSIGVPDEKHNLDDGKTVGVDLGINIPAMVALNDDMYEREAIGSRDTFLKERLKYQRRKRSMQADMKTSKGGHGRKRKLQRLDREQKNERDFAKTKNHQFSRAVIDFAIKHNAGHINMEDLSGIAKDERNQFVLRNWSYYELQQMIEYKAKKHGIQVHKINPYHTSQTCSVCGHWEEGQRIDQKTFKCKNPKCGCELNADFNAARNIAMSIEFV